MMKAGQLPVLSPAIRSLSPAGLEVGVTQLLATGCWDTFLMCIFTILLCSLTFLLCFLRPYIPRVYPYITSQLP